MRYSFESRVRYSEIGQDHALTLNAIINYFQDCSTFQSEDLGRGIDYLDKQQKVWLLSSWQIVIDRYPQLGERIITSTWAYDFRKCFGNRNFLMEDEVGRTIASANTLWTLMDIHSQRPLKIMQDDVDYYGIEDKLDMEYAPRKIAIPEGGEEKECFPVRHFHLDTNHHVNNGQYIKMARERIPEEFKISQMRAEYKKQAILGDVMIPYVAWVNNCYTVALYGENKEPYVVVEFC